jgi:hypothetical protein
MDSVVAQCVFFYNTLERLCDSISLVVLYVGSFDQLVKKISCVLTVGTTYYRCGVIYATRFCTPGYL